MTKSGANTSGFTLVELMVILAIVSILSAIAFPSYQSTVIKSRLTDGQSMLMEIMQSEQIYFSENLSYTLVLSEFGYALEGGSIESMAAFYLISAGNCETPNNALHDCVLLKATPQGAQSGAGELTLDSLGQKNWE